MSVPVLLTPPGRARAAPRRRPPQGLRGGFHVELSVRQPSHPRHRRLYAEIVVELGNHSWYGGGHLMRQHWPLEQGAWEVRAPLGRRFTRPTFSNALAAR